MQRVNRSLIVQAGRIFRLSCCIVLFLVATGVGSVGFADEGEKVSPSTTDHNKGKKRYKVKPQWKMPEHYPVDGFDGMGQVSRITVSDNKIVINDNIYMISKDTSFSTPSDINASCYLIKVGMKVGFVIDPDNKITSIWLIDMKRR